MPHADFLELLLSDEVTRRENGSAGLDTQMRLDSWDTTAAVHHDQQLWNELATLRFTEAEHCRLAAVSILIIDDFALTPLDEMATADFYELTVARHRKHATIVTSNRTPDEWITLMSDPLLAQSAVDRLASTCHELVIEGDSNR